MSNSSAENLPKSPEETSEILTAHQGVQESLSDASSVPKEEVTPEAVDEQTSAEPIDTEFDPNTLEAPAAGIEQEPEETANSSNIEALSAINSVELSDTSSNLVAQSPIEQGPSNTDTGSLIDNDELFGFVNAQQIDLASDTQLDAPTNETPTIEPQPIQDETIQLKVTEDSINSTVSGAIAEAGVFESQTVSTEFGNFAIDANGAWRYELSNQNQNVDSLRATELRQDTVEITDSTGKSYSFDIQINGNNDQAIISGDRSGRITEASNTEQRPNNTVSGKLDVVDVDTGEQGFRTLSNTDTNFGSVSMDSNGNWQYSLNNNSSAIDALTEGDVVIDTFIATSNDGTTQLVRIAIEGTNDNPIFTNVDNQRDLFLDNQESVSGSLDIRDPDFGESLFRANDNLTGKYGSGGIDENGNWTYSVDRSNADVNALQNEGFLLEDLLQAETADGTSVSLIVSIKPQTPSVADNSNIESETTLNVSIAMQPQQVQSQQAVQLEDVLSNNEGDVLTAHLGASQELGDPNAFVASTPVNLNNDAGDHQAALISLSNLG